MAEAGALALTLAGITRSFGATTVLSGLDLSIGTGEVFGLLGPNGAGKTTALRIICGLLAPDGGNGQCLGQRLGKPVHGLGYMPQRGGLYDDLSIVENLEFLARAHALDDAAATVSQALDTHGLRERRTQRVGHLSGGWRQRVALAAALLHRPRMLLLDEPSAGLDPQAREVLWTRLRQLADAGTTLLVTTHYADEAERCDRLGYLDGGRLTVTGRPDRIASDLELAVLCADRPSTLPALPDAVLIRDGNGWRLIAPAKALQAEMREPARLGDALSWLASRRGVAS